MKTRMRTRLGEKRGESIAEVLVALLISCLALVLLAGMITGASSFIDRSRRAVSAYAAAEGAVVEQGESSLEGTVTVQDASGTALRLSDEAAGTEIPVLYYTDAELGGYAVVSYRVK